MNALTQQNNAPIAYTHGLPHGFTDSTSDAQQLQYALTALAAAMHNADLTLGRLTTSTNTNTAHSASDARSLLNACMVKLSTAMEVSS